MNVGEFCGVQDDGRIVEW